MKIFSTDEKYEMDTLKLSPNITILLKHVLRDVINFSQVHAQAAHVANTSKEFTRNDEVIITLCFYMKLAIIILGITGNSISILVFARCKISTGNVGQYLIFLAIADNVVLLSELPVLKPFITVLMDKHDWICKATYYIRYTGRMWSACLTLVITVERYLFVSRPLQTTYFQKHRISRILIPMTLTISAICVIYALFLIKVQLQDGNTEKCFILKEKRAVFVVLDLVIVRGIGDLIVGAFILLFTVLCINVLQKAKKLRSQELQELSARGPAHENEGNRPTRRNTPSKETQITRMLLLLAIMFILFKVPYTVFYYCTIDWYQKELAPIEIVINNAKMISNTFALITYAFNFFVYVTLIPSYRSNLAKMFKSCLCLSVK